MNGKFVSDATRLESSPTLTAVCETPGMTTASKLEALYLAALGETIAHELDRHAHRQQPDRAKESERLADVFLDIA